jgi:solute carrier family 25 2-oxodicarboxylate transporter 21
MLFQILVMYPLDVVKTRIQLQSGKGTAGEGYTGMVDCFQKIVKTEGYIDDSFRDYIWLS